MYRIISSFFKLKNNNNGNKRILMFNNFRKTLQYSFALKQGTYDINKEEYFKLPVYEGRWVKLQLYTVISLPF